MMNLEESLRAIWDLYPSLAEKVPKERVTTGPPGKGIIPYVSIEIDRHVPSLLTNIGYLCEKVELHLNVRHNSYLDARVLVESLHRILDNQTIDDINIASSRYARTNLSGTTITRQEDRTWLFRIGVVAEVYFHNEAIPL